MVRLSLFVVVALSMLTAGPSPAQEGIADPSSGRPFPLQLQIRVPQPPTAFGSNGQTHLAYELHLTNFTGNPMQVSRIEVLDVAKPGSNPIATFSSIELATMLQSLGAPSGSDVSRMAPGGSVTAYMWIDFPRGAFVPARLSHRIVLADGVADGALIGTKTTALLVLHPPLQGAGWLASDGPGNTPDNHHRRGLVVIDGRAVISRRFAIDWMQSRHGVTFSGDFQNVHSHFAYGQPVFAVAAGVVTAAQDGLPDNIPGHDEAFHPAAPINRDTVQGNSVTLDLGGGQFAYYAHLQPGSVRVKAGDHVRAGQMLGRVGASGDAREPHLHFEVTDSPIMLGGEGLPYAINKYGVETAQGVKMERNALPLNNMIVDFGVDAKD